MAYSWTDADYHALVKAAHELGARPLDLLAVLHSESALNPGAIAYVGGKPYARGLNQITPPNAKAMGLSTAEWEAISTMTAAENLPLVVRSFRAAVGDRVYKDAGELYLVNFAPAKLAVGTTDDVVLYSAPSSAYGANGPLDVEGKGTITVGDLRKRVERDANYVAYQRAAARLRELYPGLEEPVFSQPGLVASAGIALEDLLWFFGGSILAGLGVYAWKKGYVRRARDYVARKTRR